MDLLPANHFMFAKFLEVKSNQSGSKNYKSSGPFAWDYCGSNYAARGASECWIMMHY